MCPIFPADNWWNQDITNAPVDAMSETYLTAIGRDLWFGAGFNNTDGGFPVGYVDDSVGQTEINFKYDGISDPGPYPMPKDPPIQASHDRHLILLHTDQCKLYELFYVLANETEWTADSGTIWDLTKNEKRPPGEGSADAAGLAIFPALIQYDDVESGELHHALRFAAFGAQNAYVHPATSPGHGINDPKLPPMGTRFRLKADVDISGYSPRIQTIFRALKRYGAILADRSPPDAGMYLHGIPDPRWDPAEIFTMRGIHVSDFEVLETGPITKAY